MSPERPVAPGGGAKERDHIMADLDVEETHHLLVTPDLVARLRRIVRESSVAIAADCPACAPPKGDDEGDVIP